MFVRNGLKNRPVDTALNVITWWCFFVFFTDNKTTPTKVVLSCFGLLVGLWQLITETASANGLGLEFVAMNAVLVPSSNE